MDGYHRRTEESLCHLQIHIFYIIFHIFYITVVLNNADDTDNADNVNYPLVTFAFLSIPNRPRVLGRSCSCA